MNKRNLNYLLKHFDSMKNLYNQRSDSEDDWDYKEGAPPVAHLVDTDLQFRTDDVLWVNVYAEIEAYEASVLQIGVTRHGALCYEYQSHCSCYGFHNSLLKEVTLFSSFSLLPLKDYEFSLASGQNLEKIFDTTLQQLIHHHRSLQ